MRRSGLLLWVILLFLLAALLVLVAHHEQGEVAGLHLDQFARLSTLLVLGLVIGAGVLSGFRGRLSDALVAALFWLVIVVLLAVGYTYRLPLQRVAERVIAELVPGYTLTGESVTGSGPGGQVTAEVRRSAGGEFAVRALINGASVPMLVDTGASAVVLTHEAARAAGIAVDRLTYDVAVDTANGRTRAAAVTIDRLVVGGIIERRVQALVSPPEALRTSLLGMTFLSRLDSFEFRGDRLILRGPPARP